MAVKVIECVPNFSEGRNEATVIAIAQEIGAVAGVKVLHRTMDTDHHRSVITFAGTPDGVAEAAFRAIKKAAALIDLREHEGVHPRVGSADVVPFVPIEGVTLEECARIAAETGKRIWEELGIPVYLYEAAARIPDRKRLENVRREVRNPDAIPDFGDRSRHPSAGVTVVGARNVLVAYNINLKTADVEVARNIARTVRASSGGLPRSPRSSSRSSPTPWRLRGGGAPLSCGAGCGRPPSSMSCIGAGSREAGPGAGGAPPGAWPSRRPMRESRSMY